MKIAFKLPIYLWLTTTIPQLWMDSISRSAYVGAVAAGSGKPFVQSSSRFLKFTYGDKDPFGPEHWTELEDGLDTTNACDDIWRSPISISTTLAAAHERIKFQEEFSEDEEFVETITFNFNLDLQKKEWSIGYPEDTFNGIVIHAPSTGTFQLLDRFDPVIADNEDILFDFVFASIHYCDIDDHSGRSMHQLDGKRFPFEFDMFFFKSPLGLGIDTSLMDGNVGVLVAILGEIDKEDNPRIEPMIKAAKRLHLPREFDLDAIEFERQELTMEEIIPPWSPTWLIPDVSTYYYYNDGSFPVPPCYSINRVYVLKEPIKMSFRQWSTLTNISSEREPSKILGCTFSVLQDDLEDVRYNSHEFNMRGDDGRPMNAEDKRKVKARQERDYQERMRIDLLRKGQKQSGVKIPISRSLLYLCLSCIFISVP